MITRSPPRPRSVSSCSSRAQRRRSASAAFVLVGLGGDGPLDLAQIHVDALLAHRRGNAGSDLGGVPVRRRVDDEGVGCCGGCGCGCGHDRHATSAAIACHPKIPRTDPGENHGRRTRRSGIVVTTRRSPTSRHRGGRSSKSPMTWTRARSSPASPGGPRRTTSARQPSPRAAVATSPAGAATSAAHQALQQRAP